MTKMSNFKFRVIVIPIVAFLTVVVLVGTILANIYPAALDWYLGRGERHVVETDGVSKEDVEFYENKYDDPYSALLASAAMSEKIGDEGEVLLKNIEGTLPLAAKSEVTPFGYGYINPTYGGTGSGKVDASKEYVVTAEKALHEYFTVNETVEKKMKSAPVVKLSGETVQGQDVEGYRGADQRIHLFDESIYAGTESSCADTTGIVFISRNGGEGNDMFRDYENGYADGNASLSDAGAERKSYARIFKKGLRKDGSHNKFARAHGVGGTSERRRHRRGALDRQRGSSGHGFHVPHTFGRGQPFRQNGGYMGGGFHERSDSRKLRRVRFDIYQSRYGGQAQQFRQRLHRVRRGYLHGLPLLRDSCGGR